MGWECVVAAETIPDDLFCFPDCQNILMPYYSGHKALDYMRWLADKIGNRKEHKFQKTILRQISSADFELIFCSTFNAFPLLTAMHISTQWGIPLVADLRDIAEQWGQSSYMKHTLHTGSTRLNRLLTRSYIHRTILLRNKALKHASAVTTISPWHKQFLQHINPNTHLIYNGYDELTFTPQNIVNNKFLITYTGKIYDFHLRNPQLLFEALSKLIQAHPLPDLELHFYCEDAIHTPLLQMAENYGIEHLVNIHKFIDNKQITDILHRSSICLLLTNLATSDGPHGIMTTKFFEALGVEKPVLCIRSDEECLAQVITETNAGIAASTVKEVQNFILDKYAEWQQNGFTRQPVTRERKKLFNRQTQAQQFENLFLQTLSCRPLFSVIVPIYNAEKYLDTCLQSITRQNYPHLQIILVNDGSTDNSLSIAQTYADKDSRIILLNQSNKGQGAARNKALQIAAGDWIAFVDADDCLDFNFFSSIMDEMSYIGYCDIIQLGYREITTENEEGKMHFPRHKYQYTTPWSKICSRRFLQSNNILFAEGMPFEDVVFSVRCWTHNPEIYMCGYAGYLYRKNPQSTTATNHNIKPVFELLKKEQTAAASLWNKLIVFFTRFKLRIHFFLGRK